MPGLCRCSRRVLLVEENQEVVPDASSESSDGEQDGLLPRGNTLRWGFWQRRFIGSLCFIGLCCGIFLVVIQDRVEDPHPPLLGARSDGSSVQGSERQHLKDEGQGVAKELSNEVVDLQELPPPGCPSICGTFIPCIPGITKITTTTFTSTTTSTSSTSTSSSSSSSSSTTSISASSTTDTTSTSGTTSSTSSTSTTSSSQSSSTTQSFTTTTTSSSSTSTTSTSSTSTSSTTTVPFRCSDGCEIPVYFINDNFCDCSDCGDENAWTCLTCGVGPPPASSATAIGVAAGVSMSAAIGIALGVGLGLTTGLAAIFIATGNFVISVPNAAAFQNNTNAVDALRRTVAKLADSEESEIKLILPCDKAKRRLDEIDLAAHFGIVDKNLRRGFGRRLQETLGVCSFAYAGPNLFNCHFLERPLPFPTSWTGEEASSNVCQRLSGYSSDAAQRILAEELSDIPGAGGVDVISFSASPNPIAANPNQNAGPADFFDPTQAGISLG